MQKNYKILSMHQISNHISQKQKNGFLMSFNNVNTPHLQNFQFKRKNICPSYYTLKGII
jgi:hypothetical protein